MMYIVQIHILYIPYARQNQDTGYFVICSPTKESGILRFSCEHAFFLTVKPVQTASLALVHKNIQHVTK